MDDHDPEAVRVKIVDAAGRVLESADAGLANSEIGRAWVMWRNARGA